jgi:hypothetical protein
MQKFKRALLLTTLITTGVCASETRLYCSGVVYSHWPNDVQKNYDTGTALIKVTESDMSVEGILTGVDGTYPIVVKSDLQIMAYKNGTSFSLDRYDGSFSMVDVMEGTNKFNWSVDGTCKLSKSLF